MYHSSKSEQDHVVTVLFNASKGFLLLPANKAEQIHKMHAYIAQIVVTSQST